MWRARGANLVLRPKPCARNRIPSCAIAIVDRGTHVYSAARGRSGSVPEIFVQLRELRDSLEKEFDVNFPHLSMGMTQDYLDRG